MSLRNTGLSLLAVGIFGTTANAQKTPQDTTDRELTKTIVAPQCNNEGSDTIKVGYVNGIPWYATNGVKVVTNKIFDNLRTKGPTAAVDTTTISYEIGAMLNEGTGNGTYHYKKGLTIPIVTYGGKVEHKTTKAGTFSVNASGVEGIFRDSTYSDKGSFTEDVDNHLYNLYFQRQSKNRKHTITAGQEGSGYVGGSQSTTPWSNNTSRFLEISNTTPFRLSSIKYTLTEGRITATVGFINGNQKGVFDIDGEPGAAFQFLMNIGKDNKFVAALSGLHTASESYTVPMLTWKPNDKLSIAVQGLNHQNRSSGTTMNAVAVDAGYQLNKNLKLGGIGEYTNINGQSGGQAAIAGTYNFPNTGVKGVIQAGVQYNNNNKLNPNINAGLYVNLSGSKGFKVHHQKKTR